MLNNTQDPDFQKTPEMFDILLMFSMITNGGAGFTLNNLQDQNFLDLQYMQICFNAQAKYIENQNRKVTHIGDI